MTAPLDCGPRDPAASNRLEGFCRQAQVECPIPQGEAVNTNIHVVATISTYPDGHSELSSVACDVQEGPVVTPADIEDWVTRHIPQGAVGTPAGKSLVNIGTPFWFDSKPTYDWGPFTIVQAGVRIKVTFVSVDWNFGDGTKLSTQEMGEPYDADHPCDAACTSYFSHTYARDGKMTITAQGWWKAEFSIDGGDYVALPQLVQATAATPATVAVLQAHSHLLGGN